VSSDPHPGAGIATPPHDDDAAQAEGELLLAQLTANGKKTASSSSSSSSTAAPAAALPRSWSTSEARSLAVSGSALAPSSSSSSAAALATSVSTRSRKATVDAADAPLAFDKPLRKSNPKPSESELWSAQTAGLSDEQLGEIESFRDWIASPAAPQSEWVPRDRFSAVKWLRGCKWQRQKAEKKFARYVAIRHKFGDCSLDRVAPFLATNAHSMPPNAVDVNGCGMMFVTVANVNKDHDFKTRNRCRSMIYLLDKVLASRRFQEDGLSLCIDFKDAPFSLNRSAQLDTHEIIAALPCRLGTGMIVDAPWFFSILLGIASKFTSAKLISRVALRSRDEMPSLVPREHLLRSLGGTLDFDPFVWLADEYAEQGRTPPLWVMRRGPVPPPEDEPPAK
jgi:hypothetical protein